MKTFFQLKELREKQYKISEVEKTDLIMMTIQVQSDLKKCEEIQRRAGVALKEFDSDTISYCQTQTKASWIKVVCAAVFGVGGEH